jgi:hypothetical protein
MYKRFIVIILLLFLSLPIWNGRQALAQQEKAAALDGVWRLRGYGKILCIHQGNYNNYDTTKISCVQEGKGTFHSRKIIPSSSSITSIGTGFIKLIALR